MKSIINAVCVIPTFGQEALYTRRADTVKDAPGVWQLGCGGKIEPGETPLEAAQRETKEEIGLSLTRSLCLGVLHCDDGWRVLRIWVFLLPFERSERGPGFIVRLDPPALTLDPREISDAAWVSDVVASPLVREAPRGPLAGAFNGRPLTPESSAILSVLRCEPVTVPGVTWCPLPA